MSAVSDSAVKQTRESVGWLYLWGMLRGRHALIALWLTVTAPSPPQVSTLAAPMPSAQAATGVSFEDATQASALGSFEHRAGSPQKPYLPETIGSGVALFDYNNDGWLDIYLVNALSEDARMGRVPPDSAALFRNNLDGTFADVTAPAGVANNRWGVGVCAGDINNDGWEDLYVTNFGKSRLYVNSGDGTFTDAAAKAGVQVDAWSTGCAFGDYNGDGLLDLYVAGYVDFDWDDPPPPGASPSHSAPEPGRRRGSAGSMPATGAAYDSEQAACVYYGVSVACGPKGLDPAPDFLFLNAGNGRFQDVTQESGVRAAKTSYGLAVAWVDADDDGSLDIVVANDSMPNYLFRNLGDGTFEEIGMLSGLATNGDGLEQAYMGVAVGDYTHDGRNDFFFTTFAGDNYTLHRNNGNLDFSDVTLQSGLLAATLPFLGWGTEFFDYDNDGWLDILAANGHIFPQANPESWGTSYMQRTLLFRNLHNGRFVDVSGSLGTGFNRPKNSRGAAIGDLFNDGSLDIVLNNLDGRPTVLRNHRSGPAGHWIIVKLIGNTALGMPRDAIGAVVFCEAGGLRQRGEVASGRGYLSQSDLRIHFGLGEAEEIERLEVIWPGGLRETYTPSSVDQVLVIEHGQGD